MTTWALASLALRAPSDVVAGRLAARRLAEVLGFDRQVQTRIATAVSEIARNAFAHAGGGDIDYAVDLAPGQPLFVVTVRDTGAGIDDLEAVLAGRKPHANGQGVGLASARRLVDHFDISSSPAGTVVRLAQRLPRAAAARLTPAVLRGIGAAVPRKDADALSALAEQDRELIRSLDELQARQAEATRLNRELEETNRGVVALYSELDQRAEQLRSVSDLKSRFLSHMSHEFRTPLNSILALARLLLDGVDGRLNSEQHRQVEYIRSSAQGLLEMVNDLLDLAKVEAGRLDVKPVEYEVSALFAALRGSLRPLLVNPAVELVFEDPAGIPVVYGDEQKVTQVLRNFVSNALKFTERGTVRVSARLDVAAARVVFAVEDTGIGIDPTHLDLIFEDFSQIDGRLQKGGTGLGLPLSRRLAQLMGGDVSARSELAVGSVFELQVPLRFGQSMPSPRAAGGGAPRRLLVVDDEEPFRYIVRHIAQDAGFEVQEAADGEIGLQLAQSSPPDLVVLDLLMPRVDGYGTLARLAELGLGAVPVIVCTSQVLSMDQKRALAGAYAILPKHEVSRETLGVLMKAALGGRGEEVLA